jgi:hypothetical protein
MKIHHFSLEFSMYSLPGMSKGFEPSIRYCKIENNYSHVWIGVCFHHILSMLHIVRYAAVARLHQFFFFEMCHRSMLHLCCLHYRNSIGYTQISLKFYECSKSLGSKFKLWTHFTMFAAANTEVSRILNSGSSPAGPKLPTVRSSHRSDPWPQFEREVGCLAVRFLFFHPLFQKQNSPRPVPVSRKTTIMAQAAMSHGPLHLIYLTDTIPLCRDRGRQAPVLSIYESQSPPTHAVSIKTSHTDRSGCVGGGPQNGSGGTAQERLCTCSCQ